MAASGNRSLFRDSCKNSSSSSSYKMLLRFRRDPLRFRPRFFISNQCGIATAFAADTNHCSDDVRRVAPIDFVFAAVADVRRIIGIERSIRQEGLACCTDSLTQLMAASRRISTV
jgi:hypothetical protein